MEISFKGRLIFPPRNLPTDGTNKTPLTFAQFLVADDRTQSIRVENVLACPLTLAPGLYDIKADMRAKKDKPGCSFWFNDATKVEK